MCFFIKFNKDLDASDKYHKGRVNTATWLNELIYYYIQKESKFILEFKKHILDKKKSLYDELNII